MEADAVRLETFRSRIPLADAVWRCVYRAYNRLSKPDKDKGLSKLDKDAVRRARRDAARRARRDRLAIWLPPRPLSESVRYLSVVAIMKNEGRYLREWIEFQRLMGVYRVYLYDNGSTDDTNEVVAPYVAEGFLTVIPWMTFDARAQGQIQAYAHALCNFGPQFRWMAFIDLDEFLFPVTAPDLVEVLSSYDDCPCLCVPRFIFGFAGHESPPPGLVIENYTQRAPFPPAPDCKDYRLLLGFKSIVQPAAVVSVNSAHMFDLACGITGGFDECKTLVKKEGIVRNPPPGAVLRINHYFTRSRQEFAAKINRVPEYRSATDAQKAQRALENKQRRADIIEAETVRDDVILRFAQALRQRMTAQKNAQRQQAVQEFKMAQPAGGDGK